MMKKTFAIISCVYTLSACAPFNPDGYTNRGDPERLLDVSSEVVSMPLATRSQMARLSDAVMQDPPTRAELDCQSAESLCIQAKELFDRHGIAASYTSGATNSVMLVYERVMARDCDQRYVDNSINPNNEHYSSLGCSVSANTVQMVGDKRQFVNPALLDFQDGEKAVTTYGRYLKPDEKMTQDKDWLLKDIATSGGN
jgi:hypothetical protein